ncbi:LysM peptidoglycan-binding domain-containing protein [Aspergillus affinis]|uniref:LysM peptidoglycan-binding domain-containing protein n=1 Tax=Aspergillus affinis TaxID=1070780 RepID=UPI0022FF00BE|nr:uncharacterized protein KD926_008604 [Aspergillus affinis]KAI9040041.1 hypothetical protein KD926_008604 [Aspergillus affinis]
MQLAHLLAASLVSGHAVAHESLSRRGINCGLHASADFDATCETFASSWGLSVDTLKQLNPGISCPKPDTSKMYCVFGTVNEDPSSSTFKTTATKAPTTTTTTKSASSVSPTMPGIVDNCDGFYKVSSGDQCDTIAKKHDCTNLWLDYYVCVHAPGVTTTTKKPPKPTGKPKPTPQMPGIIDNCKSFHLIEDGDSCWSIDKEAGITLAQFRSWNKEIDAGCTNLWLGYYVCVGV